MPHDRGAGLRCPARYGLPLHPGAGDGAADCQCRPLDRTGGRRSRHHFLDRRLAEGEDGQQIGKVLPGSAPAIERYGPGDKIALLIGAKIGAQRKGGPACEPRQELLGCATWIKIGRNPLDRPLERERRGGKIAVDGVVANGLLGFGTPGPGEIGPGKIGRWKIGPGKTGRRFFVIPPEQQLFEGTQEMAEERVLPVDRREIVQQVVVRCVRHGRPAMPSQG